MSNTLHLDSDTANSLAQQLGAAGQELESQAASVLSSTGGMDWTSPARQVFEEDARTLCRGLVEYADQLKRLGERLRIHAAQWENAAAGLGAGSSSAGGGSGSPGGGGGGGTGVPGGGGNADFNEVIAEHDPNGELNQKPSILEWLYGIYDALADTMGKIFAKNLLGKLIDGLSDVTSSIDLAVSSQEVADLSDQYRDAMDQYGAHSPEALEARHQYSSAELEQVLTPIAAAIIKQFGKWSELIQRYEEWKYEGRGLVGDVQ